MPNLLDPNLEKALTKDKDLLAKTAVPIVTVSAAFREDLKKYHGLPADDITPDVVFSRAHYSMTVGTLIEAWGEKISPTKAWVIDPTNYVSHRDWNRILITEWVGKTMARYTWLKAIKDFIDRFGRGLLPILNSIAPPLLYLTESVKRPILSFHIAAGNILAAQGKTVVQMVTDPHVRDEYLTHANRPNFYLCVFDEKTKTDCLEKAAILGKHLDPERVIVTGPPIDPRVLAARKHKPAWRSGPLRLCITTGGLGTNKSEIAKILEQLLPLLRKQDNQIQLMIFAGTQADIRQMVIKIAKANRLGVNQITGLNHRRPTANNDLTLLYHPQIVDANEMLIKYGFTWADGFITKPSGDMAYDAVASGSFLLTLAEWGVWEHNVSEYFEQLGVSRKAEIDHIDEQIVALMTASQGESWIERAMQRASHPQALLHHGSENILKVVRMVGQKS